MGELSEPTPGGESAARSETGSRSPSGEDRPDIRAAKTETTLRRWALALLILVPVGYVVIQKFL